MKPVCNKRCLAVLAAALLLSACAGSEDFLEPAEPNGRHPFPERHATTGSNAHTVHGIDIAKYQGDIDWQKVKQSGIAFAFIKATEGTDVRDEKFDKNWAAAKAAGIPRGAYHFNYWCKPLEDQFHFFRRVVPRDPDALPPVLDLEWNHQSPTCPRKVSRAHAKREIRKFIRLAEAWYGKRPILYTDIPFYRDVLSDGSFKQYPLWVRAVKRLPQDIYKGRKWALWQYSDRSRVPGIRGRVDKNVFAGSRREWNQLVAAKFTRGDVLTPARPQQQPNQQPARVAVAAAKPAEAKAADTEKKVAAKPAGKDDVANKVKTAATGASVVNKPASAASAGSKSTRGKSAKTKSAKAISAKAISAKAISTKTKSLALQPMALTPMSLMPAKRKREASR